MLFVCDCVLSDGCCYLCVRLFVFLVRVLRGAVADAVFIFCVTMMIAVATTLLQKARRLHISPSSRVG